MTTQNSLYITLQYLRTVDGRNKYHWALYNTGTSPPQGHLLHATDTGKAPLDLYKEVRKVTNPIKSRTMVVCLKISNSPGIQVLEHYASSIRLMDTRYLPRGERQWTCRVWVKQLLRLLHDNRYIQLPWSTDAIEQCCQTVADRNIRSMGQVRVFNDMSWTQVIALSPTTPMDLDRTAAVARYYGSSPMDIDSSGFRTKPMSTASYTSHRY